MTPIHNRLQAYDSDTDGAYFHCVNNDGKLVAVHIDEKDAKRIAEEIEHTYVPLPQDHFGDVWILGSPTQFGVITNLILEPDGWSAEINEGVLVTWCTNLYRPCQCDENGTPCHVGDKVWDREGMVYRVQVATREGIVTIKNEEGEEHMVEARNLSHHEPIYGCDDKKLNVDDIVYVFDTGRRGVIRKIEGGYAGIHFDDDPVAINIQSVSPEYLTHTNPFDLNALKYFISEERDIYRSDPGHQVSGSTLEKWVTIIDTIQNQEVQEDR